MMEAEQTADRPSDPSAPESLSLLRFFAAMDGVNRAIQGATELDAMMTAVLDVTLEVLGCDRAWLLYPCDPEAPTWRVVMERTVPEHPGAGALNVDLPMVPDVQTVIEASLAAQGPVPFGAHHAMATPPWIAESFGVQAGIAMALHAKSTPPYQFGVHQCSRARRWSDEDLRIFEGIGSRLTDALTSLLAVRRLRESQSRYRGLMDNASDAFFLLDEKGVIRDVNRRACESLGYSREELLGQTPLLFDIAADHDMLRVLGRRTLSNELVAMDSEHRRKDGTTFPVDVRIGRMDFRDRFWAVAVARDLTDRKRAAETLRASESRLRAFFDSSNVGMVRIGPTGAIERANGAFCAMLGYSQEELVGRLIPFLLFDDDVETLRGTWSAMVKGTVDRFAGEQRYRGKDGAPHFTLTHVVVQVRDAAGAPIESTAVVVDLTERKRLEEHLRRARKMEAIGQLAGGVAHDFNNLLTVINGYGEFLSSSLPPNDPRRDAVIAVRDAGERAARLTSQLLAFSRKAIVEPKIIDLNTVIEATNKMLSRLIGEDVTLVARLTTRLSPIRADAGQIEQVILNLAVNARDAMPKGGRLTISTDEIDLPPGKTWDGEDLHPGRHVRLRISDTGTGMNEETRARIFEPFFTTKGVGRGTGLGLAAVYGIVRQAGGSVAVESREGEGTTFTVLLPAIAPTHQDDSRPSTRGAETILLVEQDPGIRKLGRRILERSGYTVIDTARGIEALRLAEKHPGPIHLLLAELGAPGLAGATLFEALRALRPAVRALYIGSAAEEDAAQKGSPALAIKALQKPFSPAVLARTVRAILDEPLSPESAVPSRGPS